MDQTTEPVAAQDSDICAQISSRPPRSLIGVSWLVGELCRDILHGFRD
jgi:hypothetical protein